MYNDEYLAHFGIKGMKWGVRRSLDRLGRALAGKPRSGSGSRPTAPTKPKPKSVSEMSDEELRAKLNRFNMEKQYNQYMAEMTPKKEARFKKFALAALERGASTLVDSAFRQMATNLTSKAVADEPSISDLLGRGLDKLNTKEMQRVNSHLSAEKTLKDFLSPKKDKPSIADLIGKGAGALGTSEMQRLNAHFAAEKTLKANFNAKEMEAKVAKGKKRFYRSIEKDPTFWMRDTWDS